MKYFHVKKIFIDLFKTTLRYYLYLLFLLYLRGSTNITNLFVAIKIKSNVTKLVVSTFYKFLIINVNNVGSLWILQ